MNKFGSVVLLAGGRSKRMGFDKQLIQINGTPLVRHIIGTLKNIFNEIIIVTNNFDYYPENNVLLVSDEIPNLGPVGGILTGLKKASSQYIFVLACDMPNVNVPYIKYMMNKIGLNDSGACITKKADWIEPFNAFYSKSLIEHFERHLFLLDTDPRVKSINTSLFALINSTKCLFIEEREARVFSPDWSMFTNLNTPEELSKFFESKGIDKKEGNL